MTLSLTHPLTGLTAQAHAAVDAAQDSMSYWQKPLVAAKPAPAPQPATPVSALEQMYAYF